MQYTWQGVWQRFILQTLKKYISLKFYTEKKKKKKNLGSKISYPKKYKTSIPQVWYFSIESKEKSSTTQLVLVTLFWMSWKHIAYLSARHVLYQLTVSCKLAMFEMSRVLGMNIRYRLNWKMEPIIWKSIKLSLQSIRSSLVLAFFKVYPAFAFKPITLKFGKFTNFWTLFQMMGFIFQFGPYGIFVPSCQLV